MTISIKSLGGVLQEPPVISDLKVVGNPTQNSIDISYKVTDAELQIVRHYITVKTSTSTIYDKKEITKDVHYESPNNIFSYTIAGLEKGGSYSIQIEVFDGLDGAKSDAISVSTKGVIIHGVRVMENNSNPKTSVTYIEDSVNISPAKPTSLGGWAKEWPFNMIKIVGLKNGQETGDINQFNKKNYLDGKVVTNDVDVMVKIPKIYWNFTNIQNGYELRISDTKLDGYDCFAHKVAGVEKEFIYASCYSASVQNGRLRSVADVMPDTNKTITQYRNLAHRCGNGYEVHTWFLEELIEILRLINYKNLDGQASLGKGFAPYIKKTGSTFDKGLNFGTQDFNTQICFLGIEDLWGNVERFSDGIFLDKDFNIKICTFNKNFNDNGDGYENVGRPFSGETYGYIKKVAHSNKACFLPTDLSGSRTTFYTDYRHFANGGHNPTGRVPVFGGHGGSMSEYAGGFRIVFYNSKSIESVGTRLCYLG